MVIPSFAVERSQELLADLSLLQKGGKIPSVPVFIDSPMAILATRVFEEHARDLEELDEDPDLLSNHNFHFTSTVDESKSINRFSGGAIIMSASGMCEAGRIRHHLKHRLWSPLTTVLIVGYQAEGTLGRMLLDGKKTVRIQGESVRVRAKIEQIESYSGHADGTELKEWLLDRRPITKNIFLVHGEQNAAMAMRKTLINAGLDRDKILIPSIDDEVLLGVDEKHAELKSTRPRVKSEDLSGLDWHNELAQLQIDLREAFEQAPDKRSRNILMRRLRRALEH